ncbi:MAG: carbonic anhydrase, partial [Gammaproteobacteria bacterium]
RAGIIDGLNNLAPNSKVILDASDTDYIDEDIIDILNDSKDALKIEKNILFNFEGFQAHYDFEQTKSFIHVTTYDVQASLTPQKVFHLLCEGNLRFVKGTPIHRNYKQEMAATSASQHPIAVVLSCIDSRVPVELIFNLCLGDVFVVRIAGNIANDDILGSIEFACHVAKAKLIVVLGHKNCGAIKAACDDFHLGHITQLIDKIKPAI